jgi:HrpA-like RNA helicase
MSSTNNDINPFTNKAYSANYFVLRKAAQILPVSQRIPQLLSRIKQNNVVVVVGETGSGKTTQLPKAILLDDELKKSGKKLALTQNRRLAAQLVSRHISNSKLVNRVTNLWLPQVAERIAEEMDVQVGSAVGLKHRGRDLTSPATRLEVVTDGQSGSVCYLLVCFY